MPYIVVGVDGSETAQKALETAVQQAETAAAEVRAVSVVVLPPLSGYEAGPIEVQAMTDAAERIATTAIEKVAATYPEELPVDISYQVKLGHPGTELMRAAQQDEGAIMIVAGSRGLGGMKSFLLGSTTTFLAHHLTCPLLIVPSDESQS